MLHHQIFKFSAPFSHRQIILNNPDTENPSLTICEMMPLFVLAWSLTRNMTLDLEIFGPLKAHLSEFWGENGSGCACARAHSPVLLSLLHDEKQVRLGLSHFSGVHPPSSGSPGGEEPGGERRGGNILAHPASSQIKTEKSKRHNQSYFESILKTKSNKIISLEK